MSPPCPCAGLQGPLAWPQKFVLLLFDNSLSGALLFIRSSPCLAKLCTALVICRQSFFSDSCHPVPMPAVYANATSLTHCSPGFHINSFTQSGLNAQLRLPVLFVIFILPLESGLRDLQRRVRPGVWEKSLLLDAVQKTELRSNH